MIAKAIILFAALVAVNASVLLGHGLAHGISTGVSTSARSQDIRRLNFRNLIKFRRFKYDLLQKNYSTYLKSNV
ncbi:hypothetical protein TNIN_344851 [Trichonephila inaurata madagascariensis]|uniref:Uncharacterized protein n=1 Tax=Trichonephila inaurata madagascariensis TaxID=2747483 RepID=A0A8X6JDN2_9ARAC|nr:hypothetical protein TNIN_344851 [Trichonephila inaurata madagascariensis]